MIGKRILRELLSALWQQPLWAIPFALFFGTLVGATWPRYVMAYKISLVFAFAIRIFLDVFTIFVLPRMRVDCKRTGQFSWSEAAGFAVTTISGSYLGAWIVHLYVFPGFLGSPRAIAISGAYAIIFTLLFGGIAYAITFYRISLQRARAVEQARAELAQAELRALRAQINPHFLFNTLNAIASLISENPRAAEEATTRLAEVFRYTLATSGREVVPLADELGFLRSYLALERTRFGDRLRIEEAIEPGLDQAPVPSLLLQPVVENAVRHGISSRPEGGTIRLLARRDGDLIRLAVEDDGPGFDGARDTSGTGFGLHSVRERLRAAGPPHALEVSSTPGQGTRVAITIPLQAGIFSTTPVTKGVPQ